MEKNFGSLLKKGRKFSVNGSVWIECDGQRFFGPGPVELLDRIRATGSISQAAREMGMSYKKAWEIVNRLNANTKSPLVQTSPGGKNGGGSMISAEAMLLVKQYGELRAHFREFLSRERSKLY